MDFHEGSFDLVKTFEKFKERFGRGDRIDSTLALTAVRMANDTLGRTGTNGEELRGIRSCLLYLTFRARLRDHLWLVPLPFERRVFSPGPFGGYTDREWDQAGLLVDSLMLTVINYRHALRSYHTNLAPLIFSDVFNGFVRLCDWVETGVSLSPEKNDLLVPIDVSRVMAF